jgi:hypothetical protein
VRAWTLAADGRLSSASAVGILSSIRPSSIRRVEITVGICRRSFLSCRLRVLPFRLGSSRCGFRLFICGSACCGRRQRNAFNTDGPEHRTRQHVPNDDEAAVRGTEKEAARARPGNGADAP